MKKEVTVDDAYAGLEIIIDFIDKKYLGNRPKVLQVALETIEKELIKG